MKTIQKIAAILYSVWAVYWGCVYTYTTIHNIKNIELDGMYATIKTTYLPFLDLLCLFTTVIAISLFASSAFLIYNTFSKTYSLKRFIISVIWLAINIICLVAIYKMEYITLDMFRLKVFYLNSQNRDLNLIFSLITSRNVLYAIAGINIVLSLLRIRREKINENNS